MTTRGRRPLPVREVGAVACLALLAAGAVACASGGVEVDPPAVSGADARACGRLVAALPARVADQERREVSPGDAYAAAWGDPAIVLRCGVREPAGLDEFAICHETNGVGWFLPEEQLEDERSDVVMTTIGRAQYVEVRLPREHLPPATAMVDLAGPIKRTIREVRGCV